jgi:hypothetical protein
VDFQQRARIVENPERISAERMALFNGELRWRELFETVETEGKETLQGRPCTRVRVIPKGESMQQHYFDDATGLRHKAVIAYQTNTGPADVEIVHEDYRWVGSVRLPFVMRQISRNQERIMAADKIEQNVALPDDTFDLPCEVKRLQEENSASAPSKP